MAHKVEQCVMVDCHKCNKRHCALRGCDVTSQNTHIDRGPGFTHSETDCPCQNAQGELEKLIDLLWTLGIPFEKLDRAEQAIDRYYAERMLDLVGRDDPEYSLENHDWGNNRIRNRLRAELREAIRHKFKGGE